MSCLLAICYAVPSQAVRNELPDVVSNAPKVVKLTSIASLVALSELMWQARQAQNVISNPTPFVLATAGCLVPRWSAERLLSRFENRAIAGRR